MEQCVSAEYQHGSLPLPSLQIDEFWKGCHRPFVYGKISRRGLDCIMALNVHQSQIPLDHCFHGKLFAPKVDSFPIHLLSEAYVWDVKFNAYILFSSFSFSFF